MKKQNTYIIGIWFLSIAFLLSACSWDRRKPLQDAAFTPDLPQKKLKIIVYFDQVIEGKPLPETVWDNISGPFWNIEESMQIGFTQHYKAQFFAIPPVLLPAVAQEGVHLIDTRIVIPFGRILTNQLESALQKSFQGKMVCFDKKCVENNALKYGDSAKLEINIEKFYVWEYPLNHINYYVLGQSSYRAPHSHTMAYSFEKKYLRVQLGSVMSTHSFFIDQINRFANNFSGELILEILENGVYKADQAI